MGLGAFIGGLRRNWLQIHPPVAAKKKDAIKIGILGAANIAPMALITPALSHPGVIVYAVAARDKARATAFAKTHKIPVVKDSYDAILDDPDITAVYIPLPGGLHFEWAVKALAKGKHVLLEKPSVPNRREAEVLFNHPVLTANPSPPVLLEAFHSRFTPAWRLFQSLLSPQDISHVSATARVPAFVAKDTDIRFNFEIGGGALLDLGTYPAAAVRAAFGAEPTECVDAKLTAMAPPYERCDHTFHAKFSFPNGGVGEIDGTLRATNWWISLPTVTVTHRPVAVSSKEVKVEAGNLVTKTRKVTFVNFMFTPLYHRIDVVDEFVVTTPSNQVVKEWTKKETKKAYTFREIGVDQPGEVYWTTYRHMLEQFVNRIKGQQGTGVWVNGEDSINQARMLDMIYTKDGLGTRPESRYLKEVEEQLKE